MRQALAAPLPSACHLSPVIMRAMMIRQRHMPWPAQGAGLLEYVQVASKAGTHLMIVP